MNRTLFLNLCLLFFCSSQLFSQSAELVFGQRYFKPFNSNKSNYENQYNIGILFHSPIKDDSPWLLQASADCSLKDKFEIENKGQFSRNGFDASFLFGRLLTQQKKAFGISCYLGISAGWQKFENVDYNIQRSHVRGLISVQPTFTINRLVLRLQVTPEKTLVIKDMENSRSIDSYFYRVPYGNGNNIRTQLSVGWLF